MGSWRLINISCFENKLLGLALTLIYHQEPIILRPMFCSIDLLDFFLPQDQNIIAFLQAAFPLIAAHTHISPCRKPRTEYIWGGVESVAARGSWGTEGPQVHEVERRVALLEPWHQSRH